MNNIAVHAVFDTPSIKRNKSKTFQDADINSDHDLVMITMKLKMKKNLRNHGPRLEFNLEKLKENPQVQNDNWRQICSTLL